MVDWRSCLRLQTKFLFVQLYRHCVCKKLASETGFHGNIAAIENLQLASCFTTGEHQWKAVTEGMRRTIMTVSDWWRARKVRVLCYFVHYFGPSQGFRGKSTASVARMRYPHVRRALAQLRAQRNLTVSVCALGGRSLVPVDLDFSPIEDPTLLMYEVLNRLPDHLPDYDYFMVVEDDILVPRAIIRNTLAFDRENPLGDCLLPNRVELTEAGPQCVDLRAMPGWESPRRRFRGVQLRVARNPHSGMLLLSRAKLEYAAANVDRSFRGILVGGPMASALAHFHQPFRLFRPYENLQFHRVVHLDHWQGPAAHDVAAVR